MSTTDFTPERSAAIRQLLIDTVADEPRRRKHLQILLTSLLSGVAIALACGTAALALTGVIHLGGDTPPPPVPTPTGIVTPTPTPTPTPSPTPAAPPLVDSGVIEPHDVNSLRATTRWSLDLPGMTDCTGIRTFTLSDARAVLVSGMRPKEYEGVGDCGSQKEEDYGVTLVDTSNGTVLWQREWRFTPEKLDYRAGFTVLGTSGRAVFVGPDPTSGPHDVLDLATGETVATFHPGGDDFAPNMDMQAVPGDSGDVLVLTRKRDADGREVEDTITRVRPTAPAEPVWSTSLGKVESYLNEPVPGSSVVTAQGWSSTNGTYQTSFLDVEAGELTPVLDQQVSPMSQILVGRPYSSEGTSSDITGFGLDGRPVWTKSLAPGGFIFTASAPGDQVLGSPDTGQFFVADRATITLFDQQTGDQLWSVPTPTCITSGSGPERAMLDAANDAFVLWSGADHCELSRATGAAVGNFPSASTGRIELFGLTNVYTYVGESEPGAAYDLATGKKLWSIDRTGWPSWSFMGGYLVSVHGNHVESIG
ncbi:PQQ-binding-like beta-propeller repeat protein [Leifsonia sp. fls2-241-R2A-40a]|uniref:outer membrane protein assembly factor BamB family protein n=1 Tax=Leifsonia sp. fls2-241-R2A-40a TaxID=3040290 RepID=UPI00254E0CC7|nr:PQQ-binding-like beta-propeller repeat protein [Leifsonia sp. fls2-241-R2A-40a]